jgi:hypothetical membrane protein
MNASFVALGLLTLAGAVLTGGAWPRRRLTAFSLALVAVSGVSVVVIGLAPENIAPDVHSLAAVAQVPAQLAGMVGLAIVAWQPWRAAAIWCLLCGGIAAIGNVLFFSGHYLGMGIGGAERLSLDPFTVWTVGMGAGLLRRNARRHPVACGGGCQ